MIFYNRRRRGAGGKEAGMDLARQQARIDAIAWYHDLEFGRGLRTQPDPEAVRRRRPIWRFIEDNFDRIDFRDKNVLDVGCWDGRWSFYAEQRGAGHVLASDDIGQNGSDGRFQGVNDIHVYPPPLGLDAYDSRFRARRRLVEPAQACGRPVGDAVAADYSSVFSADV
jgi:hypothetical protein